MRPAIALATGLVCLGFVSDGAWARSAPQATPAAEVSARYRNQILSEGFLRADGWDLAGGRLVPDFDSEEFWAVAADELAVALRAALVEQRLPQVGAVPESVAGEGHPTLLTDTLLVELQAFHRAEAVPSNPLIGSQVVYQGGAGGAVEMIVAAPSPVSASDPVDVDGLFERWRLADHSGRFESAAVLYEVGDSGDRQRSLPWIASALERQTSSASVAPLRSEVELFPGGELWPLKSPFLQGMDSILQSGGGLAILSFFPGHPEGIRSAATGFRSMGLPALADRYEDAIRAPILPIPAEHKGRLAEELTALQGRRAMGSPSPFLLAVLRNGGAVRLRSRAGAALPAEAGDSVGPRPSVSLARALDAFSSDEESFGTEAAAMDLARQMTIWEAPAMAWSFLSASIEAREWITAADVFFVRVLQDSLGGPALSAKAKEQLAQKLGAASPDPLAFLNATLR